MKLFSEAIGSGAPLVALHGGLGHDHTAFKPYLAGLPARLILPDLRGCGQSPREGLASATFADFADDVDQLRTSEKWFVLGHSWGSFLAQEYALRFPERVAGLILMCTAPAFDYPPDVAKASPEQLAILQAALGAPFASDEAYAEGWRKLLPLYFKGPVPAEFMRDVKYSAPALFRGFQLLQGWSVVDKLPSLKVPALLISGRHDWITPVAQGERAAKLIPGARHVICEQSGHYPFVEETAKVREAIASAIS